MIRRRVSQLETAAAPLPVCGYYNFRAKVKNIPVRPFRNSIKERVPVDMDLKRQREFYI